jgi:acetyl esterase
MPLAPEIQAALEVAAALQLPAYWDVPVRDSRAIKGPPPCVPEPIGHSVVDKYIAGPTSDLHVRIFRPAAAAAALPALVFYHGGGFVFNNIDMYTAALHRLANKSGAVIVAVNYQKAPEHPFPAPFDDCYATLQWVVANAASLQIDARNIGVGGDSAGGNLASAVALKARDEGPSVMPPLRYQLLIYPCNDRDFTTESYRAFAEGFGLSTKSMEWFWEMYIGPVGGEHDDNPCVAALRPL